MNSSRASATFNIERRTLNLELLLSFVGSVFIIWPLSFLGSGFGFASDLGFWSLDSYRLGVRAATHKLVARKTLSQQGPAGGCWDRSDVPILRLAYKMNFGFCHCRCCDSRRRGSVPEGSHVLERAKISLGSYFERGIQAMDQGSRFSGPVSYCRIWTRWQVSMIPGIVTIGVVPASGIPSPSASAEAGYTVKVVCTTP